jgi:hypothetical protein
VGFKEDQWDLMTVLKVAKLWGFCDLALWLCGQIGSEWCRKECLGDNFPMHQKTLNFVKWIKSYDCLNLLVCTQQFLVCFQWFLVMVFQ